MRISREKIVRLSHKIMDVLVASDDVEFIEDRDTIRQHIVTLLTNSLREEEKADVEVRKKITSQKRKSSRAARSGMCCTANTTPKNYGAWECRRRPKSTGDPDLRLKREKSKKAAPVNRLFLF